MRFAPTTSPNAVADYPIDLSAIRRSKRAPVRQVRRSVHALSGKLKPVFRIGETLRQPIYGRLDSEYEVHDGDQVVGECRVRAGTVEDLRIRRDIPDEMRRRILRTIFHAMVREADRINANLSIRLTERTVPMLRPFLERFGFRQTLNHIMKRTAGAIIPPGIVRLVAGLDGSKSLDSDHK